MGFFSIRAEELGDAPFTPPRNSTCFGRFNRLFKPSGESLAWILEILPPASR
jgi:hypothetical protein